VDQRGQGRQTPLMAAAMGGHGALVELLLRHGARAGLRNEAGDTAADLARRGGHAALAERLAAARGSLLQEAVKEAETLLPR
jgi:ankyrin repeat protein